MVICLERGADLHTAQLMPLPLTVSCFSKIQIGFTFLVPAHPGSPGKRAVKRVCVCVCALGNEWWDAGVVICLERGAGLHMAQLMPLPLTVSCFSKIQIGFTFLVPAHLGSPRKGPLNGCVCVCVCVCVLGSNSRRLQCYSCDVAASLVHFNCIVHESSPVMCVSVCQTRCHHWATVSQILFMPSMTISATKLWRLIYFFSSSTAW